MDGCLAVRPALAEVAAGLVDVLGPAQGLRYVSLRANRRGEVLVELATTDEARAEVRRGAQLSLEARYRLWTGVERRIVAWRQPHSLEAVRLGLHGPQRHASEVSSPGDLSALRAAVHAGMLGRGELVAARAGGAR